MNFVRTDDGETLINLNHVATIQLTKRSDGKVQMSCIMADNECTKLSVLLFSTERAANDWVRSLLSGD